MPVWSVTMQCFIIFVLYIWTNLLNVESWKQSLVVELFSHRPFHPHFLVMWGRNFPLTLTLRGQFKEKKRKKKNMPTLNHEILPPRTVSFLKYLYIAKWNLLRIYSLRISLMNIEPRRQEMDISVLTHQSINMWPLANYNTSISSTCL